MFGAGIAVTIAKWIAGKAIDYVKQRSSDALEELRIRTGLETVKVQAGATVTVAATNAGTERQKTKMNSRVFWFLILAAEGPGLFNLAMVALYNVFFWQHGVWPQDWSIAEFPGQSAVWVNKSIDWLFDPVGQLTTVSAAGVGGYLTGRR